MMKHTRRQLLRTAGSAGLAHIFAGGGKRARNASIQDCEVYSVGELGIVELELFNMHGLSYDPRRTRFTVDKDSANAALPLIKLGMALLAKQVPEQAVFTVAAEDGYTYFQSTSAKVGALSKALSGIKLDGMVSPEFALEFSRFPKNMRARMYVSGDKAIVRLNAHFIQEFINHFPPEAISQEMNRLGKSLNEALSNLPPQEPDAPPVSPRKSGSRRI